MARREGNIWVGLVLIAIGAIILFQNFDWWPDDLRWWPLLLIGVGAGLGIEAARSGKSGGWFVPLLLIGLGIVFLLQDFDVIEEDAPVWAVVLIALGAALLVRDLPGRR